MGNKKIFTFKGGNNVRRQLEIIDKQREGNKRIIQRANKTIKEAKKHNHILNKLYGKYYRLAKKIK